MKEYEYGSFVAKLSDIAFGYESCLLQLVTFFQNCCYVVVLLNNLLKF